MSRFKIGQHTTAGFLIVDTTQGVVVERVSTFDGAMRRLEFLNEPPPAPAAPCCGSADRAKRIERALLCLLDAMAKVSPTLGYVDTGEIMAHAIKTAREMIEGDSI